MSDYESTDADQVGGGAASLGDAQSSNPPSDPEMIEEGAAPLDADTDFEGDGPAPVDEDAPDDPAPDVP